MSASNDYVLTHLYKLLWDGNQICGCGDPESAYQLVWRVVKHFDDSAKHTDKQLAAGLNAVLRNPFTPTLSDMFPDPGVRQIVVGSVESLDLIEHGSSYYSSWLTEKGKWFLWAVESIGGIEGADSKLDMVGFPQHGDNWQDPQPCTDECWKVPS